MMKLVVAALLFLYSWDSNSCEKVGFDLESAVPIDSWRIMDVRDNGVPEDDAEAFLWYKKIADQGNAEAQRKLGHMYRNGWGVPENYIRSVIWYRRAAKQGDRLAQRNLAESYYHGEGVERNLISAYVWFSMASRRRSACEGNGVPSSDYRDVKRSLTTSGDIDYAQELSLECLDSHYSNCDPGWKLW